jgi:hypothetical protein
MFLLLLLLLLALLLMLLALQLVLIKAGAITLFVRHDALHLVQHAAA